MFVDIINMFRCLISLIFDRSDVKRNVVYKDLLMKKQLVLRSIIHVLGLCHNVGALVYGLRLLKTLEGHPVDKVEQLAEYFWGMGTNWNSSLQTLFLCVTVTYDVLEWTGHADTKVGQKVRYWRDVIFTGGVFPSSMSVAISFWSIYMIDRDLVYPKVFDEVIPWWYNHCVHTNVFVLLVLETLLQARRKPTDLKMETILYMVLMFGYTIVFYTIYFCTGRWLYNVFAPMTWWQVCLFQSSVWVFIHIYYRLQFPINRLVHGKVEELVIYDGKITDLHQNNNTIVKNEDCNDVTLTKDNVGDASPNNLKYRNAGVNVCKTHL